MNAGTADQHRIAREPDCNHRRPTRRWKAVGLPLAICAAMLLASCNSSSSDGARPTTTTRPKPTTTTTAPAPVLDQASLEAAMLTVDDLPDGWKKEPAATGGEDGGVPGKICPAGDSILKNDKHPNVMVEFGESEAGPFLTQTMGSAADAAEHYADMKNAFDTCVGKTWPQEIDGSKVTVTLKAADKVSVDGESTSYKMTVAADDNTMTLETDIVLVLNRSVVEQYTGVSMTLVKDSSGVYFPDTLTRDELESIVGRGNARITTALDNA